VRLAAAAAIASVFAIAFPLALSATRAPALFPAAGGPVETGAVPRGLTSMQPADCATCHVEIAAEWAGSAHARSWTDAVFQAEYQLSAAPFCRGCHAPLIATAAWANVSQAVRAGRAPTATSPPPDRELYALAQRGVDCAVCHVREGRVLGPRGHGEADHASRRDSQLATSAFCGGCHQFNFPAPAAGGKLRYHPELAQQNTLVEWKQSRHADRSCQRCHMPVVQPAAAGVKPHRSHAFRVFDDPALLARAVKVTATARRRGASIAVTVTLSPGEIGHAFPTGDMFRRAVLTVSSGEVTRQQVLRRIFGPTLTADERGHLLGEIEDTRVPPGRPARLRFDLPVAPTGEVNAIEWTLDLYRLDPEDAARRGLPTSTIKALVQSGRISIGR
jgi:hypothetical protein